MGTLIFSCPKTCRVIEPGIETDEATFASLRCHTLSVECPYCCASHALMIKDGHLFKMRPRQSPQSTGLLCDEVDVGKLVQRTLGTNLN
jgi:hypothetical protein